MKKLFIFFFFVLFLIPKTVFANGAGLPPFFKINEKLAVSNPLQQYGVTASSFLIPQDFAPEKYVINEPINFLIDQEPLSGIIPENLISNTKYIWDFGDGSKAEGIVNTHTYSRIGSYILTVTINVYYDMNNPPTQFVDSFLINVVPDKNFKGFPKAIITMNEKVIKITPDANGIINDVLEADLKKPVTFSALESRSSSKITEYLWNFGDGQTATGPNITHRYDPNEYEYGILTVVLRVKDSKGFFSDAFIGLSNQNQTSNSLSSYLSPQTIALISFSIFIGSGILLVIFKGKKR